MTATEPMTCPICKTALAPDQADGVAVEICPSHGIWLGKDGLHRIVEAIKFRQVSQTNRKLREDDQRFDRSLNSIDSLIARSYERLALPRRRRPGPEALATASAPHPNAAVVGEGQRPCPACAKAMVPSPVDGVVADLCAAHGLWLDSGELEVIVAHIKEEQAQRADRVLRTAAGQRALHLVQDHMMQTWHGRMWW